MEWHEALYREQRFGRNRAARAFMSCNRACWIADIYAEFLVMGTMAIGQWVDEAWAFILNLTGRLVLESYQTRNTCCKCLLATINCLIGTFKVVWAVTALYVDVIIRRNTRLNLQHHLIWTSNRSNDTYCKARAQHEDSSWSCNSGTVRQLMWDHRVIHGAIIHENDSYSSTYIVSHYHSMWKVLHRHPAQPHFTYLYNSLPSLSFPSNLRPPERLAQRLERS